MKVRQQIMPPAALLKILSLSCLIVTRKLYTEGRWQVLKQVL